MKAWGPAILAVLMFLAPAADAAQGVLTLSARDELVLSGASAAHTTVRAAFVPDGRSLSSMQVHCPGLVLDVYETRAIPVGNIEMVSSSSLERHSRTNATLVVSEVVAKGWMGVYPAPDGTWFQVEGVDRLVLQPASSSILGNAPSTPEGHGRPEQASFSMAVEAPHLLFNHSGAAVFGGSLAVKLSDVVLEVASDQGADTVDLRGGSTVDLAPERVRRWAYLECPAGELTLRDARLQLASTTLATSGARSISTLAQEATLEVVGTEGSASRRAVNVEGDLTGEFTPFYRDGVAVALVRLEGDVTAASIAIPIAESLSERPSWVLFLALGVVLGGGMTYALRRRGGPRLSADQCVELAAQATELGHHGAALEWLDQALLGTPHHPRILADRAYCLGELGDIEGAIAGYKAAAAVSHDGEAHLMLARLLATLGDVPAAGEALCAALARTPHFAFEVLDDEGLHEVARTPSVARAITRALDASER